MMTLMANKEVRAFSSTQETLRIRDYYSLMIYGVGAEISKSLITYI